MKYAPAILALVALALWEVAVRFWQVPAYLVPGPIAIGAAFLADAPLLLRSLLMTLIVTGLALITSVILGVFLAGAMATSRWARAAILPWATVLQVTPIVAIAPLIIVWLDNPFASLVVCATIVAFFPVFSNTAAGLAAAPAEYLDLFRLHGASRWQTLWLLRLPAAIPALCPGCVSRAASRWWGLSWRSSWPAPAALRPASPSVLSRPGIGCRCPACLPPSCYSHWPVS